MMNLYFFRKCSSLLGMLLLVFSQVVNAQTPNLEMGIGQAGNPTGSGPVLTTSVQLQNNTNNPTGTVFAVYNPALSASFTLTNFQYPLYYTTAQLSTRETNAIGYSSAATQILRTQGSLGGNVSDFTSASSPSGQGISLTDNLAVSIKILTAALRANVKATNGKYPMGNLEITFNRAVDNPILNFSGLGGGSRFIGFSAEFDLSVESASSSPTYSKPSGNSNFVLSGNQVLHAATGNITSDANGSVKVNALGVTKIIIVLNMRGDGRSTDVNSWGDSTTDVTVGDAFNISLSAPLESDLQVLKTVSPTSEYVNNNVVFSVTAKNNGLGDNSAVNVQDLLPAGFQYVSHSAPAGTTYTPGTGLWNVGTVANGASKVLTITAKVLATGSLTNTATISSTSSVTDPTPSNNTMSATVVRLIPLDSDGDGVSDSNDLDDDNDGILDSTEMYCDQTNAPNGTFPVATTPSTTPAYTKQLLFFDWSGVTLSPGAGTNTAAKSVLFNGVTYTATISNYTSTSAGDAASRTMVGNDVNNYPTGPAWMFWRYYNVNDAVFKEILYTPTQTTSTNTMDIVVTATKGGVSYPVDLVVFDSESTDNVIKESVSYKTNASNFTLLEKLGTGAITTSNITGGGTNTVTYLNTQTSNVNALFVTTGYAPKVTATTKTIDSKQGIGFAVRLYCDTDNDGTPSFLDLDSDGDGCPDAGEGGSKFALTSLSTATGSLSTQTPNKNLGNTVDSNGVPTIASGGQGIGSSNNAAINACFCYNDANTGTAGVDTKHGITLLKRAGADNGNWPMVRKSAFTVLESNTKGFVITRLSTSEITSLVSPQEGMMVYDTTAKCLKLYDGTAWSCFVTPTCP